MRIISLSCVFMACSDPGVTSGGDGLVTDTASETQETSRASNAPTLTTTEACELGPFVRTLEVEGKACNAEPAAQCPAVPSPGSAPVLMVATCPIAASEDDCVPVFEPACPEVGDATNTALDFNLVNPNPGSAFTCWGMVHLFAERAGNGIDVHVQGFGGAPEDCDQDASDELALHLDPCCETQVDLAFPAGDFTFRLRLQLDWTRL